MFFKQAKSQAVRQLGNQNLLNLIYQTKASWDNVKETKRVIYESNVDREMLERAKLQERKYLYLYRKARKLGLHGKINDGVITR